MTQGEWTGEGVSGWYLLCVVSCRFTLELSQRMTYEQWAVAVGQRMNVDPFEIQFFKCQK